MSRQTHPTASSNHATQFGFTPIAEEEKQQQVGKVFHTVAKRYDLMNDVLSAGLHRRWKDHFVRSLNPQPGQRILDMAGGTGDIAFRIQDHIERLTRQRSLETTSMIDVADINPSMLSVGQDRALNQLRQNRERPCQLHFTCMNAEALAIEDRRYEGYTIAFGIRNVTYIDRALSEAYRCLKPGGQFACLEFCPSVHPALQTLYDRYSFDMLPTMGQWLAKDGDAYRYLAESIRLFPEPSQFAQMMMDAGFSQVRFELLNLGMVAIHRGWRL